MTIVKITELPVATTPLTGSEVIPAVQNGVTVQTAISNIGVAGAYVNVKTFGAVGNGTTDDTAAIQACIDYVNSLGGGTVFFPAGTYYVGQMYYYPGIAFLGVGPASKLLKIPSAAKFLRMFSRLTTPVITTDTPAVSWTNLYLDGNSANAPPYQNYELEQQHLIFLVGGADSGPSAGRLRAFINNCVFENGTADAVSVYNNVNLEISDCMMRECFRGGLVVTGGYTYVKANNLHMSGVVDTSRMDVEVDGAGFNGSTAVTVHLSNIYSQHGFDFSGQNLEVFGSNLTSDAGTTTWGGCQNLANMYFANCKFALSDANGFTNRFVEAGNVNFEGCVFNFFRPASLVGNQLFGLKIYWSIGTLNGDTRIIFKNSDFVLDASVLSGDTAIGVESLNNYIASNYGVTIDGCRFLGNWDVAVDTRGGFSVIRDTQMNAVVMIRQQVPSGGGAFDTTINNVIGGTITTTYMDVVSTDANGIIRHNNTLVPESYNSVTSAFGFSTINFRGGRTIQGASAPTTSTNGFPGDRYILNVPVAGSVYEYVCTGGGLGATVWKAATTLAA